MWPSCVDCLPIVNKFDGYLEDELCDQLVCGTLNDSLLLTVEDLTFKKAMELAQSDRHAQQLKASEPAVHKVTPIEAHSQDMTQRVATGVD